VGAAAGVVCWIATRTAPTMTPDHAATITLAPRLRAALDGLGPGLLAVIAALILARAFSFAFARNGVSGWDAATWRELATSVVHMAMNWLPMLAAIVVTGNLGPAHGRRRWAALALAVVAGAWIGLMLRIGSMELQFGAMTLERSAALMLPVWPRTAIQGGLLALALEAHRRQMAHRREASQAELDRATLRREETAARLQVLQAQVEPHFLFNTLANARRLCETDAAAGRVMLEHLIRYLEVALPRLREDRTTLAREAELCAAYLEIHRTRMGRRLDFEIRVPPTLAAHPVPPLMLLTLVENAVKHGINPSPRGGRLRVEAAVDGARLQLTVADTGVGLQPGSGGGVGLSNLRSRLAAQFGDAAGLELHNNELGGATATLVLPLDTEAAA
jgi:signal transduction histidine kinase